ncbi:unnamed protein product [Peronospora destructor]|uniref:Endoplasmic reticulum transmembrane protein n=1 Tax=Peronospora destructor TaxID=86335 RepID=A0AAV0TFS8_9STRA|nr:unnamed protein product [Peronospora destructor]
MLLNQFMFWMMVTEALICLILSLPFGQRLSYAVISFLMRYFGKESPANTVATVILALVSILFISDVTTLYKHHSSEEVLGDGMRIRLLTAQRDISNKYPIGKNLEAMTKQAEGAAAGYQLLLAENESFKKQTEKLHELLEGEEGDEKNKKGDALARLVQENAELEEKAKISGEKLEKAQEQVAVVTKQAEGQSSAFMKLMDEKNELDKQLETTKCQEEKLKRQQEETTKLMEERDSLKAQIQDYDFMFAEAKKKAE